MGLPKGTQLVTYHCFCFTKEEAEIQRGIHSSLLAQLPVRGEARIRAQVRLIRTAVALAVGWQKYQCVALATLPLWGLLRGPGVGEVGSLPTYQPT